jgi:hypothetical protein
MKLPRVQIKSEYIKFFGGLDTESPALSISPGALMRGMNYVCRAEGGYARIDGYERYSGKPSPSAAVYYYAPCAFSNGGPAVGDSITGVTSSSTATVITVGVNYINFTNPSAPFTATEVFNVGATAKGTFTAAQATNAETSALLHATALNLAADVYRAAIAKPAGATAVRGLALLNGTLYAFVDDATDSYGEIYKATTGGWSKITLHSEIRFTGGVAAISEGDTISQTVSSATALVRRVVLESGTWGGGDAAGRLIISSITGAFNAVNVLQVSAATKATASSLATAITIVKGGRYETIVSNFTGSTATRRIYGCDGKNRGFEFDGSVYVPINTGMTVDTPEYVTALKSQLIFSFHGSSQNSGVGLPYEWTVTMGAGEIAVGDDITGYSIEAKTLLIMSRNSSNQLFGENIENYIVEPLDAEIGAIPRTIQALGKAYCLDDRGIIQITRAQEYGNFNLATVSKRIQRVVNAMQPLVVASAVYRGETQYRLYGSDGTGISMTIGAGTNGIEYYFSEFEYPDIVSCTTAGEDSTGKDVMFFGSTTGMVYQADKGSSFDGEDIESYVWLPFNHSKSPEILKSYRKATIEMTAMGYSNFRMWAEFSYGDTDTMAQVSEIKELPGAGGHWDLSNWGDFYYDTKVVASPSLSLAGDGSNIGLVIYSKTDIDLGHTLDGVLLQYIPRRLIK